MVKNPFARGGVDAGAAGGRPVWALSFYQGDPDDPAIEPIVQHIGPMTVPIPEVGEQVKLSEYKSTKPPNQADIDDDIDHHSHGWFLVKERRFHYQRARHSDGQNGGEVHQLNLFIDLVIEPRE